jgi:tetratricopeptide (TPR) repeat protein
MKAVRISIALVLAALAAAPAYANMGGGSKSDEPQKPSSQGISSMSYTPREEAERLYADGREEVSKAKKDLEAGKAKNAEKKFKKALDKGERAVAIDPRYHEAWNLVGYSSRKLKNYDHALVAYDKCLALKPDYTLAREYLGEAYLEMGNLPKAREQLAWLQGNAAASQDAKDLAKAVADYEHAHGGAAPDSTGARPDTSRSAPADTSRSGSGW